jgi:DNA-directed RNA polymerase subunit L
VVTNEYLTEKDTRDIFPPGDYGYFIDFLRLRPKISEEIPGEKIHLTCEFSISNARDNGMYNVVSTCSYKFTVDDAAMEKELSKKKHYWKENGMDVVFQEKDWKLLDGMRITKKDSFDFIIQTIGVFTNEELLHKACDILIRKLGMLDTQIETDVIKIEDATNTMSNCYDVIIENEDYTIGKVMEYMLYSKYFESMEILSYCGFKKMHPHDSDSIIRVAYKQDTDKTTIKGHLKSCIENAIAVFVKIQSQLKSNRIQKKLTK